ncbi:hypothetical protein V8V91_02945 [Algoriphagus halophilus]|uniref:hypothetical protein n=1 Tax=Algoriphagus halophilus TaxID=226505 RepID=UPI00358FE645
MLKNIKLVLPFIAFLIASCGGKLDAGNINLDNWKSDRYGCKGLRIQDVEELQKIKQNFLGENNQSIIKTFGRPDRVELVDKSQSFFFYFLEPSGDCEGVETEKNPFGFFFE